MFGALYNRSDMRTTIAVLLVFLCLSACLATGQAALRIEVQSPQSAIAGEPYRAGLRALGGTSPFTWQVVSGDLPPGLKLDAHTGNITGTPTAAGDYHFTVQVTDSSIPPEQLRRDLNIHVIEGLTVDWKQPPAVNGGRISGSAVVTNNTAEPVDVTVIIVAVNQIGRATTLGYEHVNVPGGATHVVQFGSSPGAGTYYVRVDAAAHVPGRKHIFRASKQVDGMRVSQL